MTLLKRYIRTTKENTFVKLTLYHTKGGMSMWDYKDRPKGYMASIAIVHREDQDQCTIEQMDVFGNGWFWTLLACDRRSKKSEALARQTFEDTYNDHVTRILEKSNLTAFKSEDNHAN